MPTSLPLTTGVYACGGIGLAGYTPMPRKKVEVYAPDPLQRKVEDWADDRDMSISEAWQYLARAQLQLENTK
jgi:hypothetical protein